MYDVHQYKKCYVTIFIDTDSEYCYAQFNLKSCASITKIIKLCNIVL